MWTCIAWKLKLKKGEIFMSGKLPALGVGLGYRPVFRGELFLNRERVDFLEIVTDHYLEASPEKKAELELLKSHFSLIPHGLALSLGSAAGLNRSYLRQIANLIDEIDPPWWSEHIAYTDADGIDIGHLTPLAFSGESLDALCRNLTEVRREIETPLILENITYAFLMPESEMTEAQFLTELVERTGCGLLLDVTNLYTNAVNFGYDLDRILDDLPMESVVQLHFVGGHWQDGVLIDSHSAPAPEEVWQLLEEVMKRAPVKGVILERDENIPPFAEVSAEIERARKIGRGLGKWD